MTNEEIIKAVREVVRPYDNARTSQEFAAARRAIRQWLDDNGVPALQTDYVPDVAHGLWLQEELAKDDERIAAQLGLTATEQDERYAVKEAVHQGAGAQTRQELDAARAVVAAWLERYPDDEYGSSWHTTLDSQQLFFDISDQIDAEAEMERAKSAIRLPKEKQLAAV